MARSTGFDLARFEGQVDDHFLCAICSKVVRTPIECTLCEHLLCSSCSPDLNTCPNCGGSFISKEVALFAYKMYSRLKLRCENLPNGCEAICSMRDLPSHELICEYIIIRCASPICPNTFMKKDKETEEGKRPVCSVVCKTVVEFQAVLEGKDKGQVLMQFHQFLREAKTLVERQVRSDLEPVQKEIDQKLQEAREYAKSRDELLSELEHRKWFYHPGKWNGSASVWTCCSHNDKFALGCRKLAA